jgi:CRP/FNR family cyclic AMP-dependent transcriptional regulator
MAKHSVRLIVAPKRHASKSGTHSVPKMNRPVSHQPAPTLFSQLLGATPTSRAKYPGYQRFDSRGSLLFMEGQPATGVFVIEEGCVKLSICSGHGKSLILGFFGPQSLLGLPATILGLPHESTAETMKPVTARFLARQHLLRQISSGSAGLRAAEVVSRMFYSTLRELETLLLIESADQKLARFLLSICPPQIGGSAPTYIPLDLTHDDIAQRIGLSRETVTRSFSRLKRKGIVDLKRSVLTIFGSAALECVADFPSDLRSPRAQPVLLPRASAGPTRTLQASV